MAKKKKKKAPRKRKLDSVQNALRIVEKATGDKLAKPAKQLKKTIE